ncbi:uncharacterized protein LOC124526792 isoform X1 [Lynx rufus]|uniref:uncharacterized protein LOC124526792 isoform X1 n=1 Tax=Lynx rufus TaxID=61384 RepID=UPI001F123E49|nr:uncharacterized protein LOC124526792 isoform X1 [Lynx rufus]
MLFRHLGPCSLRNTFYDDNILVTKAQKKHLTKFNNQLYKSTLDAVAKYHKLSDFREIYYLTALEDRCLKSRYQQGSGSGAGRLVSEDYFPRGYQHSCQADARTREDTFVSTVCSNKWRLKGTKRIYWLQAVYLTSQAQKQERTSAHSVINMMVSLCSRNKSPKVFFTNTQMLTTSVTTPFPANKKIKGGRWALKLTECMEANFHHVLNAVSHIKLSLTTEEVTKGIASSERQ